MLRKQRQTVKNIRQTQAVSQINPIFKFRSIFLQLKCYSLDLWKIDKNNQKLLELRARSIEEQSNLQDRKGEKAKDLAETQTVSQLIRRTKHVKHSKICLYCCRLENRPLI